MTILGIAFFAGICLMYIWAAEQCRRRQEAEDRFTEDDQDHVS